MSKLEQLRQQVAEAFEKAEDKASIEKLAAINNSIQEAQEEFDSLVDKNADLIKSYKDLVQHTSFKDVDKKPGDTVTGAPTFTFEEALQNFMSNQK